MSELAPEPASRPALEPALLSAPELALEPPPEFAPEPTPGPAPTCSEAFTMAEDHFFALSIAVGEEGFWERYSGSFLVLLIHFLQATTIANLKTIRFM